MATFSYPTRSAASSPSIFPQSAGTPFVQDPRLLSIDTMDAEELKRALLTEVKRFYGVLNQTKRPEEKIIIYDDLHIPYVALERDHLNQEHHFIYLQMHHQQGPHIWSLDVREITQQLKTPFAYLCWIKLLELSTQAQQPSATATTHPRRKQRDIAIKQSTPTQTSFPKTSYLASSPLRQQATEHNLHTMQKAFAPPAEGKDPTQNFINLLHSVFQGQAEEARRSREHQQQLFQVFCGEMQANRNLQQSLMQQLMQLRQQQQTSFSRDQPPTYSPNHVHTTPTGNPDQKERFFETMYQRMSQNQTADRAALLQVLRNFQRTQSEHESRRLEQFLQAQGRSEQASQQRMQHMFESMQSSQERFMQASLRQNDHLAEQHRRDFHDQLDFFRQELASSRNAHQLNLETILNHLHTQRPQLDLPTARMNERMMEQFAIILDGQRDIQEEQRFLSEQINGLENLLRQSKLREEQLQQSHPAREFVSDPFQAPPTPEHPLSAFRTRETTHPENHRTNAWNEAAFLREDFLPSEQAYEETASSSPPPYESLFPNSSEEVLPRQQSPQYAEDADSIRPSPRVQQLDRALNHFDVVDEETASSVSELEVLPLRALSEASSEDVPRVPVHELSSAPIQWIEPSQTEPSLMEPSELLQLRQENERQLSKLRTIQDQMEEVKRQNQKLRSFKQMIETKFFPQSQQLGEKANLLAAQSQGFVARIQTLEDLNQQQAQALAELSEQKDDLHGQIATFLRAKEIAEQRISQLEAALTQQQETLNQKNLYIEDQQTQLEEVHQSLEEVREELQLTRDAYENLQKQSTQEKDAFLETLQNQESVQDDYKNLIGHLQQHITTYEAYAAQVQNIKDLKNPARILPSEVQQWNQRLIDLKQSLKDQKDHIQTILDTKTSPEPFSPFASPSSTEGDFSPDDDMPDLQLSAPASVSPATFTRPASVPKLLLRSDSNLLKQAVTRSASQRSLGTSPFNRSSSRRSSRSLGSRASSFLRGLDLEDHRPNPYKRFASVRSTGSRASSFLHHLDSFRSVGTTQVEKSPRMALHLRIQQLTDLLEDSKQDQSTLEENLQNMERDKRFLETRVSRLKKQIQQSRDAESALRHDLIQAGSLTSSKQAQIQALQDVHQRELQEINQRYDQLNTQTAARIQSLSSTIKQNAINQRATEEALEQNRHTLQEQRQVLQQSQARIDELQALSDRQKKRIDQLQDELFHKQRSLQEKDLALTEKTQDIVEICEILKGQKTELEERRRAATEMQAALERSNQEKSRLQTMNHQLNEQWQNLQERLQKDLDQEGSTVDVPTQRQLIQAETQRNLLQQRLQAQEQFHQATRKTLKEAQQNYEQMQATYEAQVERLHQELEQKTLFEQQKLRLDTQVQQLQRSLEEAREQQELANQQCSEWQEAFHAQEAQAIEAHQRASSLKERLDQIVQESRGKQQTIAQLERRIRELNAQLVTEQSRLSSEVTDSDASFARQEQRFEKIAQNRAALRQDLRTLITQTLDRPNLPEDYRRQLESRLYTLRNRD